MVVAGKAHGLGDLLVLFGTFEDRAGVHLADHRTLDFLPRSLRGRELEAALCLELAAAGGEFLAGDEDVRGALVQVEADAGAGLDQRQAPHGRGLRAGVEDRRAAAGARLATV